MRTVWAAKVERDGELVTFSVEGDGFLYNMVRIMAGTLLEVAQGKRSRESIKASLENGRRTAAGPTAPACGLILKRVFYDECDFIEE